MIASVSSRMIALVLAFLAAVPASTEGQEIRVTLLGTGSPRPVNHRYGPSILVEAGGQKFLFDAGRGALERLAQADVRWQDVDAVLFTHLHSDHIVGFPDLWLTGWLVNPGRDRALQVWGPPGTATMTSHLERAYEFDIRMRLSDDRAAADGVAVHAADISEGVILDKDGVQVTAFAVDHEPVTPAYGYRVDYQGRSIVLSGDTRVSQNLIRHARGVDLLVHEVVAADLLQRTAQTPERAKAVIEHHTTPEQAGGVFASAKPRLAVYSHIVPPTATDQDLIPATRGAYSGPVELGEDLMIIEVGEQVRVRRPGRALPRR